MSNQPIGIFDSGYGGLTVFRSIIEQLPGYDYIYMGDNARAPYGNRSFSTIHQYTWECVQWMFDQGCPLVILACNTASAKALRTIQQQDLKQIDDPSKRVLGVIRPTAEVIGDYTKTKEIGVLGTKGTVQSGSYLLEIQNFFPDIKVYQQACPLWVPLIENGEYDKPGADFFVQLYLDQIMAQSPNIDTILLACTHYPIIQDKIKAHLPERINVIGQGDIVAKSLVSYLNRHSEIEQKLSRNGENKFYTTTDDTADFDHHASLFFSAPVKSTFISANDLVKC
ncbi:glutamate racemase [Mucilaginibacter rubeus]|jgi:glutamate racemase|uniref:Glutamate racemase n=1 Tax=Mucilaginibacter rubeus TaxID=2027860 RepID=A0AAE6JIL6_9SPHI|nr:MULTISPECIES: glutamate racemase [Mucilaginibacter]QEM05387.1 glutamate racemase [Mucilaginibacter rubeus]QEM17975.1 glutamate racemase [Mucilaginibacter gossypii]QTE45491.1 glutamate racemase [Mucilaginibacter rubeus]QTE52088.1 glutamate racemase [Mucilaginibacter rubeus]QTE57176.1 glutamate racemase [Mucilaginibacter rubeus]